MLQSQLTIWTHITPTLHKCRWPQRSGSLGVAKPCSLQIVQGGVFFSPRYFSWIGLAPCLMFGQSAQCLLWHPVVLLEMLLPYSNSLCSKCYSSRETLPATRWWHMEGHSENKHNVLLYCLKSELFASPFPKAWGRVMSKFKKFLAPFW